MQENEKELTEDDYENETVTSKVLSALGILNTLGTLILSVESNSELLRALEDAIQPILVFVLENGVYGTILLIFALILDLFSEVFEIIDSLTFSTKSISPTMWTFLPLMHDVFTDFAVDYMDGIFPVIMLM
jgi:importin-7